MKNVTYATESASNKGARCSSVVRTFAHGAIGRRIVQKVLDFALSVSIDCVT